MSCVCMVPDGNAVWVYRYRIEPAGTTSLIGKVSERFYSGKVKDWQIIAVKLSITISDFTVYTYPNPVGQPEAKCQDARRCAKLTR
jgi:hypothetical protein